MVKAAIYVAIALAASVCLSTAEAAGADRLNVLFIVADDLRPDLGCYGNAAVHSPNLDRLAARGLVFDRAYCQVALCHPSRSSVLSGLRPDSTRVLDNGAEVRSAVPDVVMLPQFFKQHGYHSQGVGKIFHPGCDDALSWSAPHWDPQDHHRKDEDGAALVESMKSYYGPGGRAVVQSLADEAVRKGKQLSGLSRRALIGPSWEAPDVPDDELVDGKTARRAVEVLRELKDRPFFLAVGFLKPHLPFVAPKRYWDLYSPEQIDLAPGPAPENVPPPALHGWTELRACTDIPKKGPLSPEQSRRMIHGYRASTSYMDAQVGRVLDELDRLGLREKTIVMFWGDHGWQLGEHGLWCKHTNFETATRAPLIIAAPRMKAAGQHARALVEFVDIYPTLAELAGLPPPGHLEGTSFASLLSEPTRPWKKAAFSQFLRPGREKFVGRSVRTDRWRYTEWTSEGGEAVGAELYDHESDPGETHNKAGEPDWKATVKEMSAVLRAGWKAAAPPR